MKKQERCYKCGEKATTKEHVPPLCLFPEKKDIPNKDYRKNLMTVPACREHNCKKSKDDEILMAALAGVVGNNHIGYIHTKTKVRRIIERNGEDFINLFSKNNKHYTYTDSNGIKYPVSIGSPNHQRLIPSLEHIACGIYFFEKQEVFDGECKIIMAFVDHHAKNANRFVEATQRRFDHDLQYLKQKGSNPDIFKYWFGKPDKDGLIAMKMTFYGGSDVYVGFIKKGFQQPFNLLKELIDNGKTKVVVEFKDGKPPVEFN